MSACGEPTPIVLSPPPADIEAVTEAKPLPPLDIVENEQAATDYDEAIEAWGERVQSAGLRICRWFRDNGVKYRCE